MQGLPQPSGVMAVTAVLLSCGAFIGELRKRKEKKEKTGALATLMVPDARRPTPLLLCYCLLITDYYFIRSLTVAALVYQSAIRNPHSALRNSRRAPLWVAAKHLLITDYRLLFHPFACARGSDESLVIRSFAALMNPANMGSGRRGRERNSGWACVPTKNGCTLGGSSSTCMIGWSGARPEKTRPAASRRSMYCGSTS